MWVRMNYLTLIALTLFLVPLEGAFASNLTQFFSTPSAPIFRRKVFTTSTTWVVPNGINRILVEAWGAGGGGGGSTSGTDGGATSITGLFSVGGGTGGAAPTHNGASCTTPAAPGGGCTSTDDYDCTGGEGGTVSSNVAGGLPVTAPQNPWLSTTLARGNGGRSGFSFVQYWNGSAWVSCYNASGGAGGFLKGAFAVTPGSTLTVTIGTGGAGGTGTHATVGPGVSGKVVIWY